MREKWTIHEDEIVCDFYIDNKGKKPDFNALAKAINEINPRRSKGTVICRYHNFRYIDTGKGLPHFNKQQKSVFDKKKKRK